VESSKGQYFKTQPSGQGEQLFDLILAISIDHGCEDGPVLCARFLASKGHIFPVERYGPNGEFDCVIVDLDATIDQEQEQEQEQNTQPSGTWVAFLGNGCEIFIYDR